MAFGYETNWYFFITPNGSNIKLSKAVNGGYGWRKQEVCFEGKCLEIESHHKSWISWMRIRWGPSSWPNNHGDRTCWQKGWSLIGYLTEALWPMPFKNAWVASSDWKWVKVEEHCRQLTISCRKNCPLFTHCDYSDCRTCHTERLPRPNWDERLEPQVVK